MRLKNNGIILVLSKNNKLLFSSPQLLHLPHKQTRLAFGIAIFDEGKRFFQYCPRHGFGETDVQRFVFIVPKGFGKVDAICLELAGNVFVFQWIERQKNLADRLRLNFFHHIKQLPCFNSYYADTAKILLAS